MELKLRTTGRKMPFLDISIGSLFYAHEKFWTRTNYDVGTVLVESEERMGSCCNFLIDGTVTSSRSSRGVLCEEVEVVEVCT